MMFIRDLERGEKVVFWFSTDDDILERSGLVKEKAEVSEELLGDVFVEFGENLGDSRDILLEDGMESEHRSKVGEFLGEISGDFRFIREGDVFFLNSLMAGELQLETGDGVEEFV